MKRKIKNDILLVAVVFLLAGGSFLAVRLFSDVGKTVVVKHNNAVQYEDSLSKDAIVSMNSNTVIIKDGFVYMESADCKNQICVHHKKISRTGESIVCLPNRVTVEIK